ncbi:hypothetical protein E5K00_17850 [Hymenobacter aquaticus]|uniref:Uncharacterized protein n=1 Tax=Hymenobacter aquaticus TaxID=1867101 RepID=A0A4Z0PXU1_9BACT|nr:hypothetical protein [Hymenobacter aquaticus]TGE22114.1 hypothetical protein E5K00_17850 [Hymenobacter aquaticus]
MSATSQLVKEIDQRIRQELWLDFHVHSYDGTKLVIAGGKDLTYSHELEIIFSGVFFVSAFFQGWHSDVKAPVFYLPDNVRELNLQYEIEQGYTLFAFCTEEYRNDVLVAAEAVSYNTDTVFHYKRPELKANERIADSVIRNRQ